MRIFRNNCAGLIVDSQSGAGAVSAWTGGEAITVGMLRLYGGQVWQATLAYSTGQAPTYWAPGRLFSELYGLWELSSAPTTVTTTFASNAAAIYPDWSATSVSYVKGQKVFYSPTRKDYSAVGAHTSQAGREPTNTTYWSEIGTANVFAMFDGTLSKRTIAYDDLVCSFTTENAPDTLALFGLVGVSRVSVQGYASYGGAAVGDPAEGWLYYPERVWVTEGNLLPTLSTWTETRATVTAGQALTPDNAISGAALAEDDSVGVSHYIQSAVTLAEGTTYRLWTVAKAAGRDWFRLQINGWDGIARAAYFDVGSGVVGQVFSGITSSISALGGDWYYCEALIPSNTGSTAPLAVLVLAEADGDVTYNGADQIAIYLTDPVLTLASADPPDFASLRSRVSLPLTADATTWELTLTMGPEADAVLCGLVATGDAVELGITEVDATVTGLNFSVTEQDDWGNIRFLKRGYASEVRANLHVEQSRLDYVVSQLDAFQGEPVVIDYNNAQYSTTFDRLLTWGFYGNYTTSYKGFSTAQCLVSLTSQTLVEPG